jgi:hypothetical protein
LQIEQQELELESLVLQKFTKVKSMIEKQKTCKGPCGEIKLLDEFHKGDGKFKRKNKCKKCTRKYSSKYYMDNKDSILEKSNEYNKNNRERINLNRKKSHFENREIENERSRKYRKENKEKINIYKNKYEKQRRLNDPAYKLQDNIRKKIYKSIFKNYNSSSIKEILGCSVEELKRHLESQFQPGMTWENHGLYGWHIDHRVPLASFDLTDRKQLLEVWNYSNLQPLWAEENLKKGKKNER